MLHKQKNKQRNNGVDEKEEMDRGDVLHPRRQGMNGSGGAEEKSRRTIFLGDVPINVNERATIRQQWPKTMVGATEYPTKIYTIRVVRGLCPVPSSGTDS